MDDAEVLPSYSPVTNDNALSIVLVTPSTATAEPEAQAVSEEQSSPVGDTVTDPEAQVDHALLDEDDEARHEPISEEHLGKNGPVKRKTRSAQILGDFIDDDTS
eukprot:gene32866-41893_t